jgi:hypothetical protein
MPEKIGSKKGRQAGRREGGREGGRGESPEEDGGLARVQRFPPSFLPLPPLSLTSASIAAI